MFMSVDTATAFRIIYSDVSTIPPLSGNYNMPQRVKVFYLSCLDFCSRIGHLCNIFTSNVAHIYFVLYMYHATAFQLLIKVIKHYTCLSFIVNVLNHTIITCFTELIISNFKTCHRMSYLRPSVLFLSFSNLWTLVPSVILFVHFFL